MAEFKHIDLQLIQSDFDPKINDPIFELECLYFKSLKEFTKSYFKRNYQNSWR